MRTEQILYFLETINCGSFTRAAVNLHLQQPSLREAITNLENELGKPLFIRSKKGVTLTEFGEFALPYLKNMYDTYLLLTQSQLPTKNQAPFIVNLQSAFDYLTPNLYKLLIQYFKHKSFKMNYMEDSQQIINSLLQHTSNLGLCSDICGNLTESTYFQANLNKTIEMQLLFESPLVAIMSPNHPLAHKKILSLDDFKNQTIIFCTPAQPIKAFLSKHIDISQIEFVNIFNYMLMENICLTQNCIYFLPESTSYSSFLISRPIKEYMPNKFISIYRKNELSSDVLTCINHIKSLIMQNTDKYHFISH